MIFRIKDICEEKKVKVNSIADKVGISLPALYNIVNGKLSPKMETLEKIALALEVPIWQLIVSKEEVANKQDDPNTITCPHCGARFKMEEDI